MATAQPLVPGAPGSPPPTHPKPVNRFAALLAFGLLAGCSTTSTTAGRPVKAPPPAVERALPDTSQLSHALGGLPVENHADISVGGSGVLRADDNSSSPPQCAGITHAGYLPSFQGAPVRAVSRSPWKAPPGRDDSIIIVISVVELDTARDAQAWYSKTAARWAACANTEVDERYSNTVFIQKVSTVNDSDHTLTAELTVTTEDGLVTPQTNRRALALTSRFLVDVEGLVTKNSSGAAKFDATNIAQLVVKRLP
jgi:hypothetical protein